MTTIADLSVIVGANISDLQSKLRTADSNVRGFGNKANITMQDVKKAAGIAAGAVTGIGIASLKAAVDFESQFANVIKTVDGTETQLESLKDSIREMATVGDLSSLDNAHETLTNIAAIAGQLGVGVDDIEEFTRVVGGLTVATDLSGEAAATFAARFSNVTGMPITEIENLGDALVTLGNNSAAQESEIAAVANRLASLAGLNFEVDDILGYSAAIASLGLSPELGSSNLVKTITDMTNAATMGGPELQAYADVVGTTSDNFADMMKNDPSEALNSLLESLSTMDASEALASLNELGITSTEQQRTILTLAQGYDTVKDSLDLAGASFQGNGALMEEVGTKADTTAGKFNTFKNNVTDLAISLGESLLPAANEVAIGLTEMVQGLNDGDMTSTLHGLGSALQPVVDTTKGFVNEWVRLLTLGGIDELIPEDFDVGAGLASWTGAIQSLGTIVTLVTDDIRRRFAIMNLDFQLLGLEAQLALQQALPEGMQNQEYVMELKVALSEVGAERNAYDVVDRLNSYVKEAVDSGAGINLDDFVDLGDGLGLDFGEMMIGMMNSGDTDLFSEAFKMNLGDAFAAAFSEGDTGQIGELMDFSQFMTFDPGELKGALEDAMAIALDTEDTDLATFIYQVAMDLDADVDLMKFNTELTALLNAQEVSATVKANIKLNTNITHDADYGLSTSEAKGLNIDGFHTGGMFYSDSPTGEGLALLRDGERVLNPEETKEYNRGMRGRGGGGVVINYSSFGETPYNALQKIRVAASDNGY